MARRLEWSPEALEDIESIATYIERDSAWYAKAVVAKMGGHAVHAALERANVDRQEVDDVIIGCANPEGATGWNIARQIAIRAGCPVTVPGMTVNRFCSSGLQSIALAAQRIMAGEGEIFVAGGLESISLVQNEMNKHHFQA